MVGTQKVRQMREHLSYGSRLGKREISHHSINLPEVAFESRALAGLSEEIVMNGGLVFLPLRYRLSLRISQTKRVEDPLSRQINTNKWIEGSNPSLHPSRAMDGRFTDKRGQHTLNWTCNFLDQVIKPSVFTSVK